MDFTMPIAGVGGLHQHVSLPVLLRSPPAAVKRSAHLLARLRRLRERRERRERRQSPHSRGHLFTALLQFGAAAGLVLLVVVMLSTHLASQVTWTATAIPASQCLLLLCSPACSVSTGAHRHQQSSGNDGGRVAAVLI